ncbi:MAG: cobalamin-dependent protein [Desulfohalobiaceae bacterium]|nr:cobalamin-dependent protein [Desulfohalobiaceae bacterium]
MMTHRERIKAIFRGETVDVIPWVPRIDIWHNANEQAGTLPPEHAGRSVEEIHRALGWPLHKIIPEYLKPEKPEDLHHWGIGLYNLKEFPYTFAFSSDIDIRVNSEKTEDEEMTHVEYHTPVGMVSVRHGLTSEMKKSGASVSWIKEHAIKEPEDYKTLAYIFGNLTLKPSYERYNAWREFVGEDGLAVAQGLGVGCGSPMHFIQKNLLDATAFYLHYNDYPQEMAELAEALDQVYEQLLKILAASKVDAVLWCANPDDMITYPTYFENDILPWCRKIAETLRSRGIFTIIHPDGENKGLMDLISKTGLDVADAVSPYPMTKLGIKEYYDRWCRPGHLTIHGGIPETLLIEESSSWDDLKGFLDHLFRVIVPGDHFVASIGDTTPPAADFDRLIYIGERMQKEGRLPLKAGPVPPEPRKEKPGVSPEKGKTARKEVTLSVEESFRNVTEDVLNGDQKKIATHVQELLDQGHDPENILNNGMLPAMDIIGTRFKDGSVFIPEVLLSARAMDEGLKILEPHLVSQEKKGGARIMIGTVRGDLHDIGKNIVITMLKGVGYDVIDLGVNVSVDDFIENVSQQEPDILGLSALLTTTMPQIKDVIDALTEAGLREKLKIVVGGAPVNQTFADRVGADGYAGDAGEAVDLVKSMMD